MLQVAVSENRGLQQTSPELAEYKQILADIQHNVKLLQDKLAENEHKQVVRAQDFGMLIRKPYLGYRYLNPPLEQYLCLIRVSSTLYLKISLLPTITRPLNGGCLG